MIEITPLAIERLAAAIDFHLPSGWPDRLGQKVVEQASVRMGNIEQLRDRFAMAALQGALASDPHTKLEQITATADEWATCAYALADAMLQARATKAREPGGAP